MSGRDETLKSDLIGELENPDLIGESLLNIEDDIVNADAGRRRESANTLPPSEADDEARGAAGYLLEGRVALDPSL